MKIKKTYLVALSLGLILVLAMGIPSAIAQDEHDDHDSPENTCSEHDQMVGIGTDETQLSFNVSEIKVEKGSCVMFMFKNHQDIEHDFVLHDTDGEELFGLHIMNSTSHMKSIMFQMPDEDTELEFWCTVPGHKESGMEGLVVVGDGNSGLLPGFELTMAIMSFLVIIPILRLKKNN